MFRKKEVVAMLLAGGQGSRLKSLTEKTAKPAVPFGGKYRIIDFTLSNCINSGIDTVGVLTQYQPMVLNEYIGNGYPWDLDRAFGGVRILPPYQGKKSDWYKGTANAVYQNLNFVRRFSPDYVAVLSGDHIYRMDYSKMLAFHKEKRADCTIAVITVPLAEASRFGILVADAGGRITEFQEKPKAPRSTKASMGIYIFNTAVLEAALSRDEADESSDGDFGKNVIPALLSGGAALYAYDFDGYWKDVGTLDSLWEANMDLLGDKPVFDIRGKSRRVLSRTAAMPPQYIAPEASLKNALVTEGCEVYGTVENSVLFSGVCVEKGAVVRDSVIMDGACVGEGARVEYTMVDSGVRIEKGAVIGKARESGGKLTVVSATKEG